MVGPQFGAQPIIVADRYNQLINLTLRVAGGHYRLATHLPRVLTGNTYEDRWAAALLCGTPIYSSAVEDPQSYGLRAGTIRQRAQFSPRRQIWRRSAPPWVDALAVVPATEQG